MTRLACAAILLAAKDRIACSATMTGSYGFGCVTAPTSAELAAASQSGRAQLALGVSGTAIAGQVLLTSRNVGRVASPLTDVHFSNRTLLGIDGIVKGPTGVSLPSRLLDAALLSLYPAARPATDVPAIRGRAKAASWIAPLLQRAPQP